MLQATLMYLLYDLKIICWYYIFIYDNLSTCMTLMAVLTMYGKVSVNANRTLKERP